MQNRRLPNVVIVLAALLLAFAPLGAAAASLSLSPASKNVAAGDIVTLRLLVSAGGTSINNAEAVISFPTDVLQALSVDKSSSIFSLWLSEPAFSNADGTVSFNGGVPNPGYSGNGGTAISMTFRAKRAGTATLSIGSAAVRANDGMGTDVLSGQTGTTLTITSVESAPAPATPTPASTPTAPAEPSRSGSTVLITSPTNSNQNSWYNVSAPKLSLKLPEGATALQTVVSARADAAPLVTYQPPISEKTLEALPDGVWYFSARAKIAGVWGPTAHYALRIDTEAPVIASHEFTYDETERTVFVSASARDALSGIGGYTLSVDGKEGVPLPQGAFTDAPYQLRVTAPGLHTVTLTALDAAGNTAIVSGTISVPQSLENQTVFMFGSTPITLVQVILALFLLVVLALIVALFGWYRFFEYRSHLRGNVSKTATDMHRGMQVLKSNVEKHLKAIAAAKTKRELTKEEQEFASEMKENMADFERYIETDLHKLGPTHRAHRHSATQD